MRAILLAISMTLISAFTLSSAFAADEITITDFQTGVGMGCYGRCGYLDVTFKIKNIAYEKKVSVVYRDINGEWNELEAHYSRPLENGFEEWKISTNFSERNREFEFVGKYEVQGQVYCDNNYSRNFFGIFE